MWSPLAPRSDREERRQACLLMDLQCPRTIRTILGKDSSSVVYAKSVNIVHQPVSQVFGSCHTVPRTVAYCTTNKCNAPNGGATRNVV